MLDFSAPFQALILKFCKLTPVNVDRMENIGLASSYYFLQHSESLRGSGNLWHMRNR